MDAPEPSHYPTQTDDDETTDTRRLRPRKCQIFLLLRRAQRENDFEVCFVLLFYVITSTFTVGFV